jgi:hypothetical protein
MLPDREKRVERRSHSDRLLDLRLHNEVMPKDLRNDESATVECEMEGQFEEKSNNSLGLQINSSRNCNVVIIFEVTR